MAGSLVSAGAVCAAGADPSLTAWALEAGGTEAGGGARPVHTRAPVEARGGGAEVGAGLAAGPGVAGRTGAEVAPGAGAAGAAIEAGSRVTGCHLLSAGGPCVACGARAVVARGLGVAGPPVGTGRGDAAPQLCLTLWSCPTHVTHARGSLAAPVPAGAVLRGGTARAAIRAEAAGLVLLARALLLGLAQVGGT